MIGSILEWDNATGRLMDVDSGDMVWAFVAADVIGSIAVNDIVTFSTNGDLGTDSRAILVTKKA